MKWMQMMIRKSQGNCELNFAIILLVIYKNERIRIRGRQFLQEGDDLERIFWRNEDGKGQARS